MNESHGRISLKRMSKCACSITDLSHEGAYFTLENTSGTKEAELGNWKVERITHKGCIATHTFPPNFRLKKGQSIKVFGSEFANHKDKKPDDIVSKQAANFGFGDGCFRLKDNNDVQKADLEIKFT